MKTAKILTDEFLLISTLLEKESKKHSQKGMMFNHFERLKGKIDSLAEAGKDEMLIITAMNQKEIVKLMQDIKTVTMKEKVTESKSNVLKFVTNVWNMVFQSDKSLFSNQS